MKGTNWVVEFHHDGGDTIVSVADEQAGRAMLVTIRKEYGKPARLIRTIFERDVVARG